MSEPKFSKFDMPDSILDELYELTGGPESYKGMIIAYSTEDGDPVIYTRCDTQMTQYGLYKALEKYLAESLESFHIEEEDQEESP